MYARRCTGLTDDLTVMVVLHLIRRACDSARVCVAGEWLDGMTAKIPRNDAPEEIEVRVGCIR